MTNPSQNSNDKLEQIYLELIKLNKGIKAVSWVIILLAVVISIKL